MIKMNGKERGRARSEKARRDTPSVGDWTKSAGGRRTESERSGECVMEKTNVYDNNDNRYKV